MDLPSCYQKITFFGVKKSFKNSRLSEFSSNLYLCYLFPTGQSKIGLRDGRAVNLSICEKGTKTHRLTSVSASLALLEAEMRACWPWRAQFLRSSGLPSLRPWPGECVAHVNQSEAFMCGGHRRPSLTDPSCE